MQKKIRKIEQIKSVNKKKRVCAYCRVSKNTDGLERSLYNQINYFKDKITKNPNYEFVKVYFDNGISGTSKKQRVQFNQMIEDAKFHKFDVILTKSVSRFARNTVDLLETIRFLKSLNIEVRFEKENINTLSKEGEVLLTIVASIAQAEAEQISQNVKWGKRRKHERGIDQYHKLYGYDYINGKYIINGKEAKIVKFIFTEFNRGMAYEDIAKTLRNKKNKVGHKFSYPQVKVILKNEKYAGWTLLGKHYTSNPITHKRTLNQGESPRYIIENSHPPIVTKRVFEKSQDRIMKLSEKLRHGNNPVYKYVREV